MEFGSWIIGKLMMMLSGLLGTFGLSTMWMPPRLKEMSLKARYLIIGSLSTASTLCTGGWVMHKMGLSPIQIDNVMLVGFCIGLIVIPIFQAYSNLLHKNQNKTISEFAHDIKQDVKDLM
jgi:hypothetical protein